MARALGTDDAVTTCDCCGKSNLKFTVAIELDCGEVVHYGSTCASRNTGKTRPQITAEINAHKAEQIKQARREYFGHPAYIAERARFAERDRLPSRLHGLAAAEFVREHCDLAEMACKEIAARRGVNLWEVRA